MRIVVALGGNALLRRGEPLSSAAQQKAIELAARVLAQAIQAGHHLIITHGNGPQVGLLALQSAAGPADAAMPLDVLGAESEGWIGYALELALRNALPKEALVVTIVTQTLVDAGDAAFGTPTKPIGPVYDEATAHKLAELHHWSVAPDGKYWRRVVASPKPLAIVELASISRLVDHRAIVICAGGGGVPVCATPNGALHGVEAVIDKDATSALLAHALRADMFIMLSDVDGVYLDYSSSKKRRIASAAPGFLAAQGASFQAGSMAPKVRAACEFANSGYTAAIGALADLMDIIGGRKGTAISMEAQPRFASAADHFDLDQGEGPQNPLRSREIVKDHTMLVETLMTIDPVTVNPETRLADVAQIMLDRHFSGLPVVDQSGKLAGIITEGDLLRRPELGSVGKPASWLMAFLTPGRLANDYARTHTRHVREAMTADVITITRDTPLAEVAALMLRKHIKRLPVIEADRVVGIVSRSDLLRALAPQLLKTAAQHPAPAEIERSIIDTIKQEKWAPKSGVRVMVAGDIVTLEGAVFSEGERKAVFVIAENAVGVKRVIDHMVYADAGSGMVFPA